MTNIVVLIKQVPDTWSERKLTDGDFTLDREAADAVLDEINERAVEEALLIKEKEARRPSTVTVLTAGPERATEAIRKALSMGADKAVHLLDDGLHGSDMVQTGWALARALGTIEGIELVIAGNEATDGVGGAVPAIIAEYLGLPQLTHLRKVSRRRRQGHRRARDRRRRVHRSRRRCPRWSASPRRSTSRASRPSRASWPPRRRKSTTLTLAEIGVEADEVGVANAGSKVHRVDPEAAEDGGREGHRRGRGRHARSPSTWSPRRSSSRPQHPNTHERQSKTHG